MPRQRTGTVVPHGDHFDIRITYPDGTRSNCLCQPPEMSEARARDKAKRLTELAAKKGATATEAPTAPTLAGETFEAWAERWCKAREARGLTSVDDDRGRLGKWVTPTLGPRPMTEIKRLDLERLVESLDTDVQKGALEWKTARNVWGVVSKAFDDAGHSKTLALRVLTENPAAGVRGPDRGAEKAKAYLYPRELMTLVTCERVPLRWRRMYALAAYLYMRAGELRALDWPDVDFEGGFVHVFKSLTEKGIIKPTKTKETRKVPIEPRLLPLLRVLHREAKGEGSADPTGRLLTIPQKKAAAKLREHLKRAGITRADLHADDESRKPLSFHDAGRATGITWMALRGDDPLKIQRRAGHADFDTTQIYIREAEALGPDIGEPFPPLPACLLGASEGGPNGPTQRGESSGESSENLVKQDEAAKGFRKTSGVDGTRTPKNGEDRAVSAVDRGVMSDVDPSTDTPKSSNPGAETIPGRIPPPPPEAPEPPRPSPRAALAATLAGHVAELVAAGDLEAARLAAETLRRLLGDHGVAHGPVLDLEAERKRRGR
jgi:integrase